MADGKTKTGTADDLRTQVNEVRHLSSGFCVAPEELHDAAVRPIVDDVPRDINR